MSHINKLFNLSVIVITSLGFVSASHADLVFTFSDVGGVVTVTGTGTGFATKARATTSWDIINFDTDFLVDTFSSAETPSDFASGAFTNVTSGVSENIIEFRVDRDTGGGKDDIRFDVANSIAFNSGDEYLFTMAATFDVNDLTHADLILGSHVKNDGSGSDDIFGSTTLNVQAVPEPGSSALILVAAVGFTLFMRRRIGFRAEPERRQQQTAKAALPREIG